ncbi:MAG: hypothetical protein IKF39_01800 [Oscillospiraceae bacterium]|nr:hypothetical protein [Oscillospiraceae bacterium]
MDLIDRQAALTAIREYIEEYNYVDENGWHEPKWCAMKEAEMVIEGLPSAEKSGKLEWDNHYGEYHCSNCGEERPAVMGDVEWKFCPNCGAKMESEE